MSHAIPRWGRINRADITPQFSATSPDALSFATTPIEIYSDDRKLGHASGFFWRQGGSAWLITNWHVVSGNNPFTRMALITDQPPPTRLVAWDANWVETDQKTGFAFLRERKELPLFDSDGAAKWLQHSRFDSEGIDVIALRLDEWHVQKKQLQMTCVNDYGFRPMPHFAGSDVFVVGYPLNNFDGWMLPLWKKGSLSSDPFMPLDDKPAFIIDVASSRGMSGSPVFRRVFGPVPSPDFQVMHADAVVSTEFVGIYAGRLETAELERVGLGYAWYGNTIEQIFAAGVRGSTC